MSLYTGNLNKQAKHVVCIVAGGSGTRFWPLSRISKPKQFLSLDSKRSLIQQAVDRLANLVDGNLLVVTGIAHVPLVEEHLPQASILAEPAAKNTAPALAFAAAQILSEVGDVPIICLPADHIIENEEKLNQVLNDAVKLADTKNVLVTIGLMPTAPETGFGYIRKGQELGDDLNLQNSPLEISEFVEKPDLDTAKKYFESGEYFWNSGMFVWRPSVLLAAIEKYLPKLSSQIEAISKSRDEKEANDLFLSIDPISIDYGVMEKAENVALLVAEDLGWSDVGSWSAWAEVATKSADVHSNIIPEHSVSVSSSNCYVHSKSKPVAIVGLKNLVIVETDDALLVCDKNHAQDVKTVVDELKKRGKLELI